MTFLHELCKQFVFAKYDHIWHTKLTNAKPEEEKRTKTKIMKHEIALER